MKAYQLNQLQFAHKKAPVIDIQALSIPSQACTVILGDNGAGKTTLLSLLGFVLTPDWGEIHYQDLKVSKQNRFSLRRRIAALHQRPYLFRGTVLNNAALSLKLRGVPEDIAREKAMRGLDQVGLSRLAQRSASRLSGGEAQRTALARCMVTNPEVLLLDEPFSHLDRHSIDLIQGVISDFLNNAGTLVFSTHDHQRWPELADYVVTLENGRPVENYWK